MLNFTRLASHQHSTLSGDPSKRCSQAHCYTTHGTASRNTFGFVPRGLAQPKFRSLGTLSWRGDDANTQSSDLRRGRHALESPDVSATLGANISFARRSAFHTVSGLYWSISKLQHLQPLSLASTVSWGRARRPGSHLHSYILNHRSARGSAPLQQLHSHGQGQGSHTTSPRCSRTRLSQSLSCPDG